MPTKLYLLNFFEVVNNSLWIRILKVLIFQELRDIFTVRMNELIIFDIALYKLKVERKRRSMI